MSCELPKGLTGALVQRGDDNLEAAEAKYGSADDYVREKSMEEIVQYGAERIAVYLDLVKRGKGDVPGHLADCFNHLRFMFAKFQLVRDDDADTVVDDPNRNPKVTW